MAIHEIGFKLQHDCPFNELSKRYPDIAMYHWCNYSKDVLKLSLSNRFELLQEIQRNLKELGTQYGLRIIRRTLTNTDVQLVIGCCCGKIRPNVSSTLEKHNFLELQPIVYKDGWEWYRTVAFASMDIKRLFGHLSKFANVEIFSRTKKDEAFSERENITISASSLFGSLTRKQFDALRTALRLNYYDVPKKTSTQEMAKHLGMPQSTYEEHLRKAESKVLRSVAPHVELLSFPA